MDKKKSAFWIFKFKAFYWDCFHGAAKWMKKYEYANSLSDFLKISVA